MFDLEDNLKKAVKGFDSESKAEFTDCIFKAASTQSYDLCWCRSGLIFKNCHKDRKLQRKLNEYEVRTEVSKIFDSKKYCCASYDAQNCELPIKGAHTIQRGRVLSSLAENGHVGTFYRNMDGFDNSHKLKRGVKKEASIFYGFCHYRDTELFKAIELTEFNITRENAWASSYRAVCHEFYQKKAAINVVKWQRLNFDRGLKLYEQVLVQNKILTNEINVRKGLPDIQAIKNSHEKAIVEGELNGIKSYVIKFDDVLTIAVCASISPYYDLNQNKIQNMGINNEDFQHFSISTVTMDGQAAYVISHLSEHKVIESYLSDVFSKGNAFIKHWLMKSIFAYTENCYFKLSWWSALPKDIQEKIYELAMSENYTKPFEYDDLVSSSVVGEVSSVISI